MGKTKFATEKFEVTLAHKRSNRLDVTKGAFVQPKLDGVRCYTRLKENGEIGMFSRNHKEFMNCNHLKAQLYDVFTGSPDIVLDGELYNHEYRDNFNKIISIVRKQKPTPEDMTESAAKLEYHVYDMFDFNNPDLKYVGRLSKLHHNVIDCPKVHLVETFDAFHEADVLHHEEKFLKQGYEGAMLRINDTYQQRRSHGLQKVKRFHDSEFTITGFIEGKGKFTGGLGKFLGVDEDGREIEVPFQKCTIENRKRIWETRNDYYLGKVATFEYFERTPAGAYRFPQFKGIRDYE